MGEENICRLCFNLVKDEYELIDEVTRQMLEVLLLKVDLDISKKPIVCHDCGGIIRKSYLFKSACIDTEELIHSFSTVNETAQFDIKEVYQNSKDVKVVASEDVNICRFCMNQVERNSCVSVDVLLRNSMYSDMLPIFVLKMDLNIIQDPVVCISCKQNLDCYFKFIQTCLEMEEKINKYRQSEGTMSQIKSSIVLSSLFKDALTHPDEYVQKTAIKRESLFEEVQQNVQFEMHGHIKCEEAIDVKVEDVILDVSCDNLLEIPIDKFECKLHNDASTLNYETENGADNSNRDAEMLVENSCKDIPQANMFKCGICTYETKYKNHLKSHVLIHKDSSEVEMYECEICTYKSRYKHHIKGHMLKHQNVREVNMHKCEICGYETKYKPVLKRHMLVHKDASEVKMYKCEKCTYETKYKTCIKTHMLNHEDLSEVNRHKCEICSYETKYKRLLKSHMLIHTNTSEIDMYSCESCGYQTKYKHHLKTHMLRHRNASEVKMHKCEKCTYESKYKNCLKTHMVTHKDLSEVEMYKCGICIYETKHKRCFKRHMLLHTDMSEVKMNKCEMCTYETKNKSRLKSHMLIHNDA